MYGIRAREREVRRESESLAKLIKKKSKMGIVYGGRMYVNKSLFNRDSGSQYSFPLGPLVRLLGLSKELRPPSPSS